MATMTRRFPLPATLAVVACLAGATIKLVGQATPPNREWRTYGADLANTHYAPLDQINRDNFGKLQVAWRFYAVDGQRHDLRHRRIAPRRRRARC
jgi:glucose dehydrogenase